MNIKTILGIIAAIGGGAVSAVAGIANYKNGRRDQNELDCAALEAASEALRDDVQNNETETEEEKESE